MKHSRSKDPCTKHILSVDPKTLVRRKIVCSSSSSSIGKGYYIISMCWGNKVTLSLVPRNQQYCWGNKVTLSLVPHNQQYCWGNKYHPITGTSQPAILSVVQPKGSPYYCYYRNSNIGGTQHFYQINY